MDSKINTDNHECINSRMNENVYPLIMKIQCTSQLFKILLIVIIIVITVVIIGVNVIISGEGSR